MKYSLFMSSTSFACKYILFFSEVSDIHFTLIFISNCSLYFTFGCISMNSVTVLQFQTKIVHHIVSVVLLFHNFCQKSLFDHKERAID